MYCYGFMFAAKSILSRIALNFKELWSFIPYLSKLYDRNSTYVKAVGPPSLYTHTRVCLYIYMYTFISICLD